MYKDMYGTSGHSPCPPPHSENGWVPYNCVPGQRSYYLTAYDIACLHGFRGSEEDWLESLRGENARFCFESEQAMKADRKLMPGDYPLVMSDSGIAIYAVREAGRLETVDEGSTLLILDNGYCAERLDRSLEPDIYKSPFSTPPSIQNEILQCGLSYYRHQHNLIYGNDYTANNTLTNPADTPHRNTDGSKRYEIDCSSFVELVTSGVPFEHSRYNEENTENTRMHDWGFDWFGKEKYYCNHEARQGRMLANDLAVYCRDRGWLFKPRGDYDFSNLQTGDILFWTGDTDEPGYWEDIRHVGIFVWKSGYGNIITLDASTSHPAGVMVVRTRVTSTPYAKRLVWCARLPYSTERLAVAPENLLANPDKVNGRTWDNQETVFLADLRFKRPITPYHYYTITVKISQAPEQYPQDICIRFSGTPVTIDRQMRPYKISPDGVYTFHFFVTDDDCIINRPDGELEVWDFDHNHLLLCAYAYDEQEQFISAGAVQTHTVVEWAEIFEGIWLPDHANPASPLDFVTFDAPVVNITNSVSPVDALHTESDTAKWYINTIRTVDATDTNATGGLPVGSNFVLVGWRQSSEFGKQIASEYRSNLIWTRNCVNNVWSRFVSISADLSDSDNSRIVSLERRSALYSMLYSFDGGPINVSFSAPQRDVLILIDLPSGTARPTCSIYFKQGEDICGQGYCSSSTLSSDGALLARCWDEHGMFLSEYVSQGSSAAVNKYSYANRVMPVGIGITELESTASFPDGVSIRIYGIPM